MECNFCNKKIDKEYKCRLCQNIFCSNICVISHFSKIHSNTNQITGIENQNKDLLIQKLSDKLLNNIIIISPYITEGNYLKGEIKYDNKYSLNNFFRLTSKGKDIILGAGTFGQVYLAQNKIDHKLYAIKHMEKNRLSNCLSSLNTIYNEIDIQSRINHPNIIKILNVIETKKSFDLILEYANSGNLFHHIRRNKGLSEQQSFKFFIQVANAIYFMQKNNLIHRDLKPENILLIDYNIVKLCDFGWCVELSSKKRSTYCGTTEYMAPEIVSQSNYDKSIDVWSLGILLYELIHGYSPFRAIKQKNNDNEIIENIKIHNLKFDKEVSYECKELIIGLLHNNVNKRLKIEDIFNSKFVKKYEILNYNIPHQKKNDSINLDNKSEYYIRNNNNDDSYLFLNSNKKILNHELIRQQSTQIIADFVKVNLNKKNNEENKKTENSELRNIKMKLQKEKFLQIQKGKDLNMNEPLNKTYIKMKKKKEETFESFVNLSNLKLQEHQKSFIISDFHLDFQKKDKEKNIFEEIQMKNKRNKSEFLGPMISFEKNNSDEESKFEELQKTPKKSILEENFIPPKLLLNNNWDGQFNKMKKYNMTKNSVLKL